MSKLLKSLTFQDSLNVAKSGGDISPNDIAIIGMSFRLPNADTKQALWENLIGGIGSVQEMPFLRQKDAKGYLQAEGIPLDTKILRGAFLPHIDQFDSAFFKLSPNEAMLMDPNQRLFLETGWNALEDAGFTTKELCGKRMGVFVGYRADEPYDYKRLISHLAPQDTSMAMAGNINSIIASRLSYLLDLKGPCLCVDTACSSSLAAIHLAVRGIRNGECDSALVGSVKVKLLPIDDNQKLGIESPRGIVRSYDDYSDGTGFGEGVAALVLKPLSDALEHKDNIYGVIKGSSMNQDGRSIGLTAPNAIAQRDVILDAWRDANIDPLSVSYIEGHGTGTKLGDPIEVNGIEMAFREYTDMRQFCGLGTVKANIAHLDCAAGIAGVIKMLLCLQKKMLPPAINFKKPNREIDFINSPVFINNILHDWDAPYPRRCGINSFGLSGTNVHLILEEAPAVKMENVDVKGNEHYLLISAKTTDALLEYCRNYIEYLEGEDIPSLQDICCTAVNHRESYEKQICVVGKTVSDVSKSLWNALDIGIENAWDANVFVLNGVRPKTLDDSCRQTIILDWMEGRPSIQNQYSGNGKIVSIPCYPFRGHRCWVSDLAKKNSGMIQFSNELTSSEESVETTIIKIWAMVLGVDDIKEYTDFFDVGGDSIIAQKIANSMLACLHIPVSAVDVIKHRTVKALGEYCRSISTSVTSEKIVIQERYPLSPAQELIYLSCIAKSNTTYNLPVLLIIPGIVDEEKLQACVNKLIRRHRVLRTVIEIRDGRPNQRVVSELDYLVESFESEETEAELYKNLVQPFNMDSLPLFRIKLIKQLNKTLLFFDIHHIISDGSSMNIFSSELIALYNDTEVKLPPLKWQYAQYVEWLQQIRESGPYNKQLQYWTDTLKDYAVSVDSTSNKMLTETEYSYIKYFCEEEYFNQNIENYTQVHKITLFTVYLSAYCLMLHNNLESERILLGIPVSGRNHPDITSTLGMFVNTLPFVSSLDCQISLDDYVYSVQTQLNTALSNQNVYLQDIQRQFEQEGKRIVIDVIISYQSDQADIKFDENCIAKLYQPENRESTFDLILQIFQDGNRLYGFFEHNSNVIGQREASDMLSEIHDWLCNIIKNGKSPIAKVKQKFERQTNDNKDEVPQFIF